MMHELEYHDSAVFVTLTYDDDHVLDVDGSIRRDEFQNFMKRLRERVSPRRLMYYACGEYGGKTGRPHFHAIIFGLKMCGDCSSCSTWRRGFGKGPTDGSDCEHLLLAWDRGMVHVGDVTRGSCRYVADYLQKNVGEVDFGGREKAFSLMSKGIGKRWMMDHLDQVEKLELQKGTRKRVGVPRYYRKKLIDLHSESMFDYKDIIRSVLAHRALTRDRSDMEWLTNRYDSVELGKGYRKVLWQGNANRGERARLREPVL
jgi:hypothetical protein